MIADEVVNEIYVQAGTIRADGVLTALPNLLLHYREVPFDFDLFDGLFSLVRSTI